MQKLRRLERVRLDRHRLDEIVARFGPHGADDLISRAMEELAVQLAKVHKAYQRAALCEVESAALKIGEVAAHVGMPGFARVAGDVARLARRNDGAALSATVARLGRIGECSLMKVWDLQDLSV